MVSDGAPDWPYSYFILVHFSVACSKHKISTIKGVLFPILKGYQRSHSPVDNLIDPTPTKPNQKITQPLWHPNSWNFVDNLACPYGMRRGSWLVILIFYFISFFSCLFKNTKYSISKGYQRSHSPVDNLIDPTPTKPNPKNHSTSIAPLFMKFCW